MEETKRKERMQPHQHKATNKVNYWIKDHGMQPSTFHKKPLLELQALMQSNNLLGLDDDILTDEEKELLKEFRTRSNSTQRGNNPTVRQCHQVLNLMKAVKGRISKQFALVKAKREELRKKQASQ